MPALKKPKPPMRFLIISAIIGGLFVYFLSGGRGLPFTASSTINQLIGITGYTLMVFIMLWAVTILQTGSSDPLKRR
jgi:hypothetical protein